MTVALHDLPCEAQAPQLARRWTAQSLRARLGDAPSVPELIDDTVLCMSELVTNAVHAGCSNVTLELRVEDDAVRVAVVDDAPGRPTPRAAAPGDRNGRGLRLIEAVSRRWGVDAVAMGKSVWAEFALPA